MFAPSGSPTAPATRLSWMLALTLTLGSALAQEPGATPPAAASAATEAPNPAAPAAPDDFADEALASGRDAADDEASIPQVAGPPDDGLPIYDSVGDDPAPAPAAAPAATEADGTGASLRPRTVELFRGARAPVRYDRSLASIAKMRPAAYRTAFRDWHQSTTSAALLDQAAAAATLDPLRGAEDAVHMLLTEVLVPASSGPPVTLDHVLSASDTEAQHLQAFRSGLASGLHEVLLDETSGGLALARLDPELARRLGHWEQEVSRRLWVFRRGRSGGKPVARPTSEHVRAYVACLSVVEVATLAARAASAEGWELPGRAISKAGALDSAEVARMAVLGAYQRYASARSSVAVPSRIAFEAPLSDATSRGFLVLFLGLVTLGTLSMTLRAGRDLPPPVRVEDPLDKMAD